MEQKSVFNNQRLEQLVSGTIAYCIWSTLFLYSYVRLFLYQHLLFYNNLTHQKRSEVSHGRDTPHSCCENFPFTSILHPCKSFTRCCICWENAWGHFTVHNLDFMSVANLQSSTMWLHSRRSTGATDPLSKSLWPKVSLTFNILKSSEALKTEPQAGF